LILARSFPTVALRFASTTISGYVPNPSDDAVNSGVRTTVTSKEEVATEWDASIFHTSRSALMFSYGKRH
jgi:hypothetical protein